MKTDYKSPLEHSSSPDGCREDCPACEDERPHEAGGELAAALHLQRDREHKDRWQTAWGTKTNAGLVRTLREMLARIDTGREL